MRCDRTNTCHDHRPTVAHINTDRSSRQWQELVTAIQALFRNMFRELFHHARDMCPSRPNALQVRRSAPDDTSVWWRATALGLQRPGYSARAAALGYSARTTAPLQPRPGAYASTVSGNPLRHTPSRQQVANWPLACSVVVQRYDYIQRN